MKVNILIIGYTGSGKTSLIQAICGDNIVPTSAIGHGSSKTKDFIPYEIGNLRFFDSEGFLAGHEEKEYIEWFNEFILGQQRTKGTDEQIHLVWYCIMGPGGRVTNSDKQLIKKLFTNTLVVITQNDIIKKEQIESIQKELEEVNIPNSNIIFTSSDEKTGLNRLLERTYEIMPKAQKDSKDSVEAFIKQRIKDFESYAEGQADELCWWGAGRAALLTIVPIPIADMPMLIANEAYMITRIGTVYGINVTKSVIASFLGTVGASIAGMTLADFIPFLKIPIAAGITYGVGKAAVAWFKNDMNMSDEELKEIYDKSKSEAKNIDWKTEAKKYDP
jgi:uncharacterized protein (DUF697 family)/GTP-binding protein EngB required for normal cell division